LQVAQPAGAVLEVRLEIVGGVTEAGVPAALFTIAFFKLLGLDEQTLKGLITSVLSIALLLTAVALLFKDRILKLAQRDEGAVSLLHHRHLTAATITTGAIVGGGW
jgi:hypothetical protein